MLCRLPHGLGLLVAYGQALRHFRRRRGRGHGQGDAGGGLQPQRPDGSAAGLLEPLRRLD